MIYPVVRVELRRWDAMTFIRHEWELLCMAMQAKPRLCKVYKHGLHWGHIAYMFGVGLFAYGPYAHIALVVAILMVVAPMFGEHE